VKPAHAARLAPRFLLRYLKHFEAEIERALAEFAAQIPAGARVLDAGSGQGQYRPFFSRQRYTGIDLGIGDAAWDYSRVNVRGNLESLPFPDCAFAAAINIVTLEHVRNPACVLAELARVLEPGGRLLLAAPLEWEEHQQPHDYYRFTRYALKDLLARAGFTGLRIEPAGGIFRLLSRRILAGAEFVPFPFDLLYLLPMAPLAFALPLLDGLDQRRNFTLGYICWAQKR
jgi:SAM-dependent methyltransferase